MRTIDSRSHIPALVLAIAVVVSAAPLAAQARPATLFREVRVFDGTRMLPPVSLPTSNGEPPAATMAPAPPLEPPGDRSRPYGLLVRP